MYDGYKEGYRDIYKKEQSYTPFSEMDEVDVPKNGKSEKRVSYSELDEDTQSHCWCKLYENILKKNIKYLKDRANKEDETIEDLAEEMTDTILNNNEYKMNLDAWRKFPIGKILFDSNEA